MRRGLVDVHLRAVPLVVREGDRAVRLRLGSRRNAASRGSGNAAWGKCDATALKPAHRRAISSRCSSSERPSACAQRAVDEREGLHRGRHDPPSISILVTISSVGSCSSSGCGAVLHGVDHGDAGAAGDGRAPRRFSADDQRDVEPCRRGSPRARRSTASAGGCPVATSTVCASGGADALGDDAARVGVLPGPAAARRRAGPRGGWRARRCPSAAVRAAAIISSSASSPLPGSSRCCDATPTPTITGVRGSIASMSAGLIAADVTYVGRRSGTRNRCARRTRRPRRSRS